MNRERVERIIRALLVELGEDPTRPALAASPGRLADLLAPFDVTSPAPIARTLPWASSAIVVYDLDFMSLCEHHLLPFFGGMRIGLLPRDRIVDVGECRRLVDSFAHRPQLQERLTEQVADALVDVLAPDGVAVAAQGRHMCMMMRGVQKQRSAIVTSSLRGAFREPGRRRSFFAHAGRP